MAVSKKRKSKSKGSAPQRGAKRLFMPMEPADADSMVLSVRIALESIRRQTNGQAEAMAIAQALLMTTYLTEAGYGTLDLTQLANIERGMNETLIAGAKTDDWRFSAPVADAMVVLINEHDRQLHEVRVGAILDATRRLQRLLVNTSDSTVPIRHRNRPALG